jgi:hypothetical protein
MRVKIRIKEGRYRLWSKTKIMFVWKKEIYTMDENKFYAKLKEVQQQSYD